MEIIFTVSYMEMCSRQEMSKEIHHFLPSFLVSNLYFRFLCLAETKPPFRNETAAICFITFCVLHENLRLLYSKGQIYIWS